MTSPSSNNTTNNSSSSRATLALPRSKPPLPLGLASLNVSRSNSTVNKSMLNDLLNPSHTSHHSNHTIEIPDASTPYYSPSSITRTPSSSSMLYGSMSSSIGTSSHSLGTNRKFSESFRLKSSHSPILLPKKECNHGLKYSSSVYGAGSSSQYRNNDEFANLKLKSKLNRQLSVNSGILRSSLLSANSNTGSAHRTSLSATNQNTSPTNNNLISNNSSGANTQSLQRKKKKFSSTLSSSASFLQRKRHSIESLIGFCKPSPLSLPLTY